MAKKQNQKNTNKKSTQKREPRVIETLVKTVDTVEELIEIVKSLPGAANEILADHLETITDLKDLELTITDIFARNVPDIQTKENTFWSLSVSMDKAFLKTGRYIGFGWAINKTFNQKEKKFDITSIDIKFVTYDKMRTIDEINALYDMGFDVVEK